ncbi:FMN reductase [Bradyrhizobium niftali]|uniref:NADPH-dependent FMN reductase n=1 Tax=Bradyrhizobium niftali TaxID=2560055 RepID=UPI0038363A4B
MLKITIVVGNPKSKSRTAQIARLLVRQVFSSENPDLELIDLADHADEIFVWPSEKMDALTKRVKDSNFALFASPTYKATYTGLLKAFLDRYPANGLQGIAAACLMTGAGAGHSMAPTTSLVPLLFELGASVPVRGLYFSTTQMDQIDDLIAALGAEVINALKSLAPAVLALGQQARAIAEEGVK